MTHPLGGSTRRASASDILYTFPTTPYYSPECLLYVSQNQLICLQINYVRQKFESFCAFFFPMSVILNSLMNITLTPLYFAELLFEGLPVSFQFPDCHSLDISISLNAVEFYETGHSFIIFSSLWVSGTVPVDSLSSLLNSLISTYFYLSVHLSISLLTYLIYWLLFPPLCVSVSLGSVLSHFALFLTSP